MNLVASKWDQARNPGQNVQHLQSCPKEIVPSGGGGGFSCIFPTLFFVHSMDLMTSCLAHGQELGVGQGKEQIMGHLGCKKQICFQ